MMIFMQTDMDPHSSHVSYSGFYYFLILAPIVVLAIAYITIKVMKRIENRKNRSAEYDDQSTKK